MYSHNIKRIWFHVGRFRSQLIYGSFISAIYVALFALIYPGDEGIKTYSDAINSTALAPLFNSMNTSNPGWTFWIAIQTNLILYFTLAICAVLMGRKLVPTQERDALEIFLGVNPQSARRFYAENMFAALFNLILICIPSFIVIVISSIIHKASDIIGRVLVTYILLLVIATIFLVISSMSAVLQFSSSSGMKIGMGYLVLAFMSELLFADKQSTSDFANISVNFYAKISDELLTGSFNWSPVMVIFTLILIGVSFTYWKVKFPDYLETEIKVPEKVDITELTTQPDSRITHKYALFFDQLRNDFKALFAIMIFCAFIFMAIIAQYVEATIDAVLASSDTPSIRAMIQNNKLQYNYTGFVVVKFFALHWAYIGIFVALASANVVTREVRFDSQDILWSADIKPPRLAFERALAILAEITILTWGLCLIETGLELLYNRSINHVRVFETYSLIWVEMIGLSLLLITITMLPQLSKGRTLALMTYIAFVIINLIAYSSTKIEFLKYFTYFSYSDSVGVLFGYDNYFIELLKAITLAIFSGAIFVIVVYKKYYNKDLL